MSGEVITQNPPIIGQVIPSSLKDDRLAFAEHTAESTGYDHKQVHKENKTVLGYFSKRKVEKVVDNISVILTIKGVAKGVIAGIELIVKKIKAISNAVERVDGLYGFGFDALGTAVSVYSLYDDGVHAVKAFKKGDGEETRDRSVAFSSAGGNISAISLGAAAYAEGAKATAPAVAKAVTLGLAASSIGLALSSTFIVMQGIAIKRIATAFSRLKKSFSGNSSPEEKYKTAIDIIKNQIVVTKEESAKINEKVQHLSGAKKEVKEKKLIVNLIEKKHNKLKKRVGAAMAARIIEEVGALSMTLQASDDTMRQGALVKAESFVEAYKQALNKALSVRILKVAGGVIGLAGSVISLSNPITGGLIAGIATGFLIYAWYQGRYKKADTFRELSIFGHKIFNFDLPVIKAVEESVKGSAKKVDAVGKDSMSASTQSSSRRASMSSDDEASVQLDPIVLAKKPQSEKLRQFAEQQAASKADHLEAMQLLLDKQRAMHELFSKYMMGDVALAD